jgi:hypothetical protein
VLGYIYVYTPKLRIYFVVYLTTLSLEKAKAIGRPLCGPRLRLSEVEVAEDKHI